MLDWIEIDNSSPLGWLIVIAISVGAAIVLKGVLKFLEGRVRSFTAKWNGVFDDFVIEILASTKVWITFFWFFYPASRNMETTTGVHNFIFGTFVVASALQITIWGLRCIAVWRDDFLKRKIAKDSGSVSAIGLMSTALQGAFIVAVALFCLSNLGVNITALIAGMGIGGIAVALAAQNILGDLFASLSIVLDKPFVVGDFIVAGQESGTVENIGIKTTRLRSLSGEELIFANKDLLESRIKNFKRMWQRRIVLKFSVNYETPIEKLERIPLWIKSYIDAEQLLKFDRSHLSNYGESGLEFETVFWVKDPDFNKYMDVQQILFFKLLNQFKSEKINFAVPTRHLQFDISDVQGQNKEKSELATALLKPNERIDSTFNN